MFSAESTNIIPILDPMMVANYPDLYDPEIVTKSAEFRVISPNETVTKEVNIGCAYNPAHEIHLVQLPIPNPREGEVVVHIKSTGICGSDCHFWKHGAIGPTMVVRSEVCAGHESAGVVVSVGDGVTRWKKGDRVCLEAGIPCSQPSCDPCRSGRYNGCPNVVFFSTPPYHGLLKRWHAHPQEWLHRLPDNLSYEEGSLCEPLAVALAGIDRVNVRLGDPLLITGAGPIGLVSLLAAHAAGCTPIVLTDINQERLAFAKKLIPGVQTCLVGRKKTAEETARAIKMLCGEVELKHALECTGAESSIKTAILSMGFGGKVMVIGVGASEQMVPFMWLSAHEIDLMYLYRYSNQYPKALRLIGSGMIDIAPLVTHRFPLERAVDAFHTVVDPAQGCIKAQIQDL